MEVKNRQSEWCQMRIHKAGRVLEAIDSTDTEEFVRLLSDANSVFVTGRGRSGLVARCFAMRLMQMGMATHVVGETTCPHINPGELLVTCSCSGETTTTLQMASKANEIGAIVVGLTSQKESTLSEVASHVVRIPVEHGVSASEDNTGVFPDNTVFEETVFLYFDVVIELLMDRMNVPSERLTQLHANLE